MTTEQRLVAALEATRSYEPSPDLWSRVVHSIEEDRRHRRRVVTTALVIAGTIVVAALIAFATLETQVLPSGISRYRFDWSVVEALSLSLLLVLMTALGPAIRRFGRGYAADLFVRTPQTGMAMLRLLDVAYYLVFSGYAVMTIRFSASRAYRLFDPGGQVEDVMMRAGVMLLLMGVLHAVTLMAMPLIALVHNATLAGRRLPKWVTIILIVGGVIAAQQVLGLPLLLFALGSDG
jgi:hypothetical protein